jgi:hypothetical protein
LNKDNDMASKLTKHQQETLDLLNSGWELGVSSSLTGGNVWLQENGVGKGGATKKVRRSVYEALREGGHIVRIGEHTPTYIYGAAKR